MTWCADIRVGSGDCCHIYSVHGALSAACRGVNAKGCMVIRELSACDLVGLFYT